MGLSAPIRKRKLRKYGTVQESLCVASRRRFRRVSDLFFLDSPQNCPRPRAPFFLVAGTGDCYTSHLMTNPQLYTLLAAGALTLGCSSRFHPVTSGGPVTTPAGSTQPNLISIPPTGVIRISADDLLAQFQADADAADRVFRDRTVEVTGKVVYVGKTKTGKPVVTFGEVGRVLSPHVECYFQASDNPKVLVGERCTIRGQCMGKSMGVGAWVNDCVVLPNPEPD